jgi:DNA-binding MarR family transcriptional regulator
MQINRMASRPKRNPPPADDEPAQPSPWWGPPSLELRLGFLIHDVSRLRRTTFDQIMRPLGVTRAQWWIIAHLSRHDGMTQVQLAKLLDVGKASLGALVGHLETAGLVIRRSDRADGRAKRVYMTPKARRLAEAIHANERQYNSHALKDLNAAERAELVRMLTLIKHTLSGMDRTGIAD